MIPARFDVSRFPTGARSRLFAFVVRSKSLNGTFN
jgi:hypothetical protein